MSKTSILGKLLSHQFVGERFELEFGFEFVFEIEFEFELEFEFHQLGERDQTINSGK